MTLINTALLSRWQNWATILLMLAIATMAVNVLSRLVLPANTEQK